MSFLPINTPKAPVDETPKLAVVEDKKPGFLDSLFTTNRTPLSYLDKSDNWNGIGMSRLDEFTRDMTQYFDDPKVLTVDRFKNLTTIIATSNKTFDYKGNTRTVGNYLSDVIRHCNKYNKRRSDLIPYLTADLINNLTSGLSCFDDSQIAKINPDVFRSIKLKSSSTFPGLTSEQFRQLKLNPLYENIDQTTRQIYETKFSSDSSIPSALTEYRHTEQPKPSNVINFPISESPQTLSTRESEYMTPGFTSYVKTPSTRPSDMLPIRTTETSSKPSDMLPIRTTETPLSRTTTETHSINIPTETPMMVISSLITSPVKTPKEVSPSKIISSTVTPSKKSTETSPSKTTTPTITPSKTITTPSQTIMTPSKTITTPSQTIMTLTKQSSRVTTETPSEHEIRKVTERNTELNKNVTDSKGINTDTPLTQSTSSHVSSQMDKFDKFLSDTPKTVTSSTHVNFDGKDLNIYCLVSFMANEQKFLQSYRESCSRYIKQLVVNDRLSMDKLFALLKNGDSTTTSMERMRKLHELNMGIFNFVLKNDEFRNASEEVKTNVYQNALDLADRSIDYFNQIPIDSNFANVSSVKMLSQLSFLSIYYHKRLDNEKLDHDDAEVDKMKSDITTYFQSLVNKINQIRTSELSRLNQDITAKIAKANEEMTQSLATQKQTLEQLSGIKQIIDKFDSSVKTFLNDNKL